MFDFIKKIFYAIIFSPAQGEIMRWSGRIIGEGFVNDEGILFR